MYVYAYRKKLAGIMKKTLNILILAGLCFQTGLSQGRYDSVPKFKIGLNAGTIFSYLIPGDNTPNSQMYDQDFFAKGKVGTGINIGVFSELVCSKKITFRFDCGYNILINKIKYIRISQSFGSTNTDTANYTLYHPLTRLSLGPSYYFNKSRLFFSIGLNLEFPCKRLSYTKGYIHSYSPAHLGWDSTYYPEYDVIIHDKEIFDHLELLYANGLLMRFGGQVLRKNKRLMLDFTIYQLFPHNLIRFPAFKNMCGSINLTYLIKK